MANKRGRPKGSKNKVKKNKQTFERLFKEPTENEKNGLPPGPFIKCENETGYSDLVICKFYCKQDCKSFRDELKRKV